MCLYSFQSAERQHNDVLKVYEWFLSHQKLINEDTVSVIYRFSRHAYVNCVTNSDFAVRKKIDVLDFMQSMSLDL